MAIGEAHTGGDVQRGGRDEKKELRHRITNRKIAANGQAKREGRRLKRKRLI